MLRDYGEVSLNCDQTEMDMVSSHTPEKKLFPAGKPEKKNYPRQQSRYFPCQTLFLKLIYKISLYINTVYNEDGVLEVSRTRQVTKLEIPVRRAKGALGDVTVHWSLYQNESSRVELLWPTSGKVTLSDGQWNKSFIVNVDNEKEKAQESVVWVQLDKTTGGAVLASYDQTTAKILIAGNERSGTSWRWIVTGACSGLLFILLVVVLVWWVRRK